MSTIFLKKIVSSLDWLSVYLIFLCTLLYEIVYCHLVSPKSQHVLLHFAFPIKLYNEIIRVKTFLEHLEFFAYSYIVLISSQWFYFKNCHLYLLCWNGNKRRHLTWQSPIGTDLYGRNESCNVIFSPSNGTLWVTRWFLFHWGGHEKLAQNHRIIR